MLRILFLVMKTQRADLDRLYDGIAATCDCELRRLDSDQQRNLKRYFKDIDCSDYDHVMIMLRNKKVMKQARFLRKIPNLVFLEHDAWQNYTDHKYKGKFSRLYRKLPGAIVISSGCTVARKLRDEGIDARFVPKGYDQALLSDLGKQRDIEAAFVGSVKNSAYQDRAAFLSELVRRGEVQILRTESGDEYLQALNRIRFFISADIRFGEYMLKNFEAMACGCVLFAYDQGEEENQALGFKDMENLVLYRDVDELLEKLQTVQRDPELADRIRRAGQSLVAERFRFDLIGRDVVRALEATTTSGKGTPR